MKVGDKVILKTWDEIKDTCESYTWKHDPFLAEDMEEFLGRVVTISLIDGIYIDIEEDDGEYAWHITWIKEEEILPKELFEI